MSKWFIGTTSNWRLKHKSLRSVNPELKDSKIIIHRPYLKVKKVEKYYAKSERLGVTSDFEAIVSCLTEDRLQVEIVDD